MIRAARAVYFTALGLWVGGMATLAFVVAPTVFRTAPSRAIAGTIFGSVLRSFGPVQIVLGIVAVLAVAVLLKSREVQPRSGWLRLSVLVVMLLVACNAQFVLGPAIERERNSIPNFDSVPAGVPVRARFDSLHAWSVRLASVSLLAGVGLLAVSAARAKSSDGP
jgi:uncharacterized protein DUF4149